MRMMLLLWLLASPIYAQETKKTLDTKELDKQLLESLREVHNRGAELYNSGDVQGCYRMFQGALHLARATLIHRPAEQKQIEEGMAAVEKQEAISRRAFMLHDLIEKVRNSIKDDLRKPSIIKVEQLIIPPREVIKTIEKRNETPTELKKTIEPILKIESGVRGRILFQRKYLPGVVVTFVTRGLQQIRVYECVSNMDGFYQLPDLPAGNYTILIVPGKNCPIKELPTRYALTNTSPIMMQVLPNGDTLDFYLQ